MHPSEQLRDMFTTAENEQFMDTKTEALWNVLIDLADRLKNVEQRLGQDD